MDDKFDRYADSDTKQEVWDALTGDGSGYTNSQSGQNLNVSAGAEWVSFKNFLDSEKLEYNNSLLQLKTSKAAILYSGLYKTLCV